MEQFNRKNAPRLAHVVEPSYPVYYRPKITTPSSIIADEQVGNFVENFLHTYSLNYCGHGYHISFVLKILSLYFLQRQKDLVLDIS